MKESFEEMGIPTRILEFTSSAGKRGFNVEATLQGTEGEKHLWVSAHLDSYYNAGADDDASGLVSVLSTAKVLKKLNPKNTVHFVAYDLEEDYMVGSSFYAESVVSAIRGREGDGAVIGELHSDMIGYNEGEFEAVMETCAQAATIDEAILRALEALDSPISLSSACITPSDHQRFWEVGLPAVMIVESTHPREGYPWYHQPGDTMDKLDIPYLRSMIQLNAVAATLLAVSPASTSS